MYNAGVPLVQRGHSIMCPDVVCVSLSVNLRKSLKHFLFEWLMTRSKSKDCVYIASLGFGESTREKQPK